METPDLIENAKLLIKHFGYFPTFHDDVITNMNFDLKKSSMEITIMSNRKNKKCFIILLFNKIKKIIMEGFEPNCNIIFEMNFTKNNEGFMIEVHPSVGMYANIICEKVIVKKMVLVQANRQD